MKKRYIICFLLVLGVMFTTFLTVNASSNTLVTIDFPAVNESFLDNVFVRGWVMSKEDNVELEIYIDNKKITEEINRHERGDVISLIKDYGDETTNPLPGYQTNIDINSYSYGKHNVTVKAIKNGNVLASETREFIKKAPATMISIDIPSSSEQIINDTMTLKGWIMSEYQDPTLEIYLDNVKQEVEINRHERGDVLAAIKDYGSASINTKPGYLTTLDIRSLEYGSHTVKVVAKDKVGNTLYEETRKFTKKAPATMISIDIPSSNEKIANDTMTLKGWMMSEYQDPTLEIYLDNVKQEVEINRHERGDVLAVIKDYGSASINKNPGYLTTLNITSLEYGSHTVKVVAKDKVGNTLYEETRKFTKKAPATMISIDIPSSNEKIANDTMTLKGWVMSEYQDPTLEIYLDDVKQEVEINRHERGDVLATIKDYGSASINSNPGYMTTLNISSLEYGSHTVKVVAKDKVGNTLYEETRKFTKKAPATMISIDIPSSNEKVGTDTMTLKGWVMSEYQDSTLEIYLDDVKQEVEINRHEREDVLRAIKNYGSASINTKPGYLSTLDIRSLEYGSHTVKVVAKDKVGNTLYEETRKFTKKKPDTMLSIDIPSVNGKVNRIFSVQGWVMSEDKDSYIVVAVDGEVVETTIKRNEREDVLNAIKGYGGVSNNPLPGYSTANIDLSGYLDGSHKVTVSVYSKNGQFLTSETRSFELEKYNSTINISSPTNTTYKNSLDIKGYVLSEATNTNVDLYIDNNLIAANIERFNENNLDSSLYEDYGGIANNPLPNYTYSYNVTDLLDGSHTLTVKLKLATGEVIETKNVKFNVSKYESLITVDFPNPGNVNKEDNLFIRGWIMSEDSNTTVKIYLDNKEITEYVDRHEREDVLILVPGYGGRETNSLPGYSATVDLSNYSTGYHTLTIKAFNHLNEEFNRYDKTLYIYDGFDLGIDVSQHNGNIDWNTVKNSGGVDFAFIRLGYRGYGTAGNIALDTRFVSNVNSASNAGIDTGIYFFSQATNYQEGVEEARYIFYTLNMNPGLKEKLDYPIMLDVEYSTDPSGNGRADHISNEARSEAVRGFLETMNSYGLRPGIYANKDFLTNKLDLARFNNYDTWLAHWTYDFNKRSDYNGAYKIWQYSDCGAVSGMNGCVDLDISYQN